MRIGFMWDVLRWLVSVPLALFGALAIAGNITAIVLAMMHRWKGSLVPVLGGVYLSAGMLICPVPMLALYAWLPLVIDPGCGFVMTLLVLSLLKQWLESLAH